MDQRTFEGTWEEIARKGHELAGCRVRLTVLDELASPSVPAPRNGSHAEGEETAFDVLNRAGLIGCLKTSPDAPSDLSTNPEHMESFGRD